MYILGINGSPRIGGNTDILLDKALLGASSRGAKTEKVILSSLKISPCLECEKVKSDGTCKVEDGFQSIYEKILTSGGLILASPVFFGSLSAQTKIMIDRFQCYWRYKHAIKKSASVKIRKGAFISAEASTRDDFFDNAKAVVRNFFVTVDAEYKHELFCKGTHSKGAVLEKPHFLDLAYQLGEALAGGKAC